jgi:hypothetical protein
VEVTIDGLPYEENVNKDLDNKPLLNKAKEPYPEGVVKTFYDEEIALTFRTNVVDPSVTAARRGRINNDSITMNIHGYVRTFDEFTLKLSKARQRTVVGTADEPYWQTEYVLHYREAGWQPNIVERGYHYLNDDGDPVPEEDANGVDTGAPVYLDADGKKLADGADVVLTQFRIFEDIDFSPLFAGL